MPTIPSSPERGLKLKEICERVGVDYDDARYLLASGVLPDYTAESSPGRGNHRVFNNSQALMLAVILKLRAAGVSSAVARSIANWPSVIQSKSGIPQWDPRIPLVAGKLSAENALYLDVGDARFVRVVANAKPNPSDDASHLPPWINMKTRRVAPGERPSVIFRIDFIRIAHLLLRPDRDA